MEGQSLSQVHRPMSSHLQDQGESRKREGSARERRQSAVGRRMTKRGLEHALINQGSTGLQPLSSTIYVSYWT